MANDTETLPSLRRTTSAPSTANERLNELLGGQEDYRRIGEAILREGLLPAAEEEMRRAYREQVPASRVEVSEALAPLFEAYGKDGEDRAKVYTVALHGEGLQLFAIKRAVRALIVSSKWLPSVAEVIGEARVAQARANDRWTAVRYAARLLAQAST